jgi:hypothetical protein
VLRLYGVENSVYTLPPFKNSVSGETNADFQREIEMLNDSLELKKSILVYFDNCAWRTNYPNEEYIKKEFGNFHVDEFNDGFILYNENNTSVIK